MSSLVIVESPTKAKTISKFLGRGFVVKSSFGHLRDLPKKDMGIDVENNFAPHYVISREKSKTVKELKDAAKKTNDILFATDEDREGEAISWHLAHILGVEPEKTKRIVFHEITKQAIDHALANPRLLDLKLVDAQQARRILDRLVGYELSPFLWRKVAKGLSAGRVQSVAVRLVVEREREIQNFKSEEYWTIEGIFEGNEERETKKEENKFIARLFAVADKKLDKLDLKNKEQVDKILTDLTNATYKIANVEQKESKRLPSPPFITSTLQQEANHRLGYSAKQIMRLAQQLYEGVEIPGAGSVGLITYMRTDSVNLSEKFLTDAQEVISKEFGKQYSLDKPRFYHKKSKNAQEAHEAIRPTEAARTPESIKNALDNQQYKLYDLIWRRAVASQMAAAELKSTTVDIVSNNNYTFRATGQIIAFDGFLKLYTDKAKENILPNIKTGETINCQEIKPEQHFTEPPARYSDATLVKTLEKFGIGRPSTYAPTIATIEDRNYVERDEHKRLKPKDIAFLVNDLLVEHFNKIVDFKFTADMEGYLDDVAAGKQQWQKVIADFYGPFKENLEIKNKELKKKEITEEKTDEICEKCNAPMVIKTGRFGKFLACSGYPTCKNTKKITGSTDGKIIYEKKEIELTDVKCEKCGTLMAKRHGRFGPFLGCSAYPKCKNIVNIEVKLNLKCPKCQEGDIVERHSKRGKPFYGCNRYPNCDFALWDKPTGDKCDKCAQPLVFKAKGEIKCSNKECSG